MLVTYSMTIRDLIVTFELTGTFQLIATSEWIATFQLIATSQLISTFQLSNRNSGASANGLDFEIPSENIKILLYNSKTSVDV